MAWDDELVDKFTEQDAQYVMSIAISAVMRRGKRGVWSSITATLSPKFKNKFFHPVYDFFANSDRFGRVCSAKAKKEDLETLEKVINDPFYAVRLGKGDEIADALINFSKKVYIDAFRDIEKRPCHQQPQVYARKILQVKIKSTCDEDIAKIILSGSFVRTCEQILYSYMSAKEQVLLSGNKYTPDGKIKARVPKGSEVKTSDLFAREAAAREVGAWGRTAQDKNPRPRREGSRPKMNRDGGPA